VYAVFLGLIQFLINPSFHYMSPKFFTNPEAFRKWLEKNHKTAAELVVGFHKIGIAQLVAGRRSGFVFRLDRWGAYFH
jgi:hypothetical protein